MLGSKRSDRCARPQAIRVAAALLLVASAASASVLAPATWYQFSYFEPGDPTFGCNPADLDGLFCTASGGAPTIFAADTPWTFTLANATPFLVVDAFESGDRFEVFDFGTSIGATSAPQAGADCGADPDVCRKKSAMSKGSFLLAAGAHSITIGVTAGGTGTGYMAVPEPSGSGLVALACLALLALRRRAARFAVLAGALAAGIAGADATRFAGPTSSQPIALSGDDGVLAVANPDDDSVTLFDVKGDRNLLAARIPVLDEPNGVALTPDGRKGYVANSGSDRVSVLVLNLRNGVAFRPSAQLPVGAEPYAVCMAPNGTRVYVANARSNSVTVIDVATDSIVSTIQVGREPRGLAMTNDGDADDLDETLVVTSFLAEPSLGGTRGADDTSRGRVTLISTGANQSFATIDVNPMQDTGFLAAGDALARIAPSGPPSHATGAYPNQLHSVGIRGSRVYLPSTAASPNGPLGFDVNVQSLLSVVDLGTELDAGLTINLQAAVAAQTNPARRFLTQPWAIAFEHAANRAWIASAASDVLARIAIDPTTGAPTVRMDPNDPTAVFEIPVGKNPRGIVVNAADTRAYVMNYVSRDVTIVDLAPARERVMATLRSTPLPVVGSQEDAIHAGRELFHTSIGTFDPATPGGPAITGRMSESGWLSCASCHPFGLSDGAVWIFDSGPRRTPSLHADFDAEDHMRVLGGSAIADEQADFEVVLRDAMGGAGLIVEADGATPAADVTLLRPLASGGRNQLALRGVRAWDAIEAYVESGVRAPHPPALGLDPDVITGRALFNAANCQLCHGGPQWTRSLLTFTPPPSAGQVSDGQLTSALRNVGTFDSNAFNEVRQAGSAPLGSAGYAIPSLLSAFALEGAGQLHGGAAASFDEVLQNVTHRSAGTSGVDTLSNASDRQRIGTFLRSIDATTQPFP